MNKNIIIIDVSTIHPKKVEELMDRWIQKHYNLNPTKKGWQRFKLWLYNICDTLGWANLF